MGPEMVADTQGLVYSFFVIEFKADVPGGSKSLWVATNQCHGKSTSCVNSTERTPLRKIESRWKIRLQPLAVQQRE